MSKKFDFLGSAVWNVKSLKSKALVMENEVGRHPSLGWEVFTEPLVLPEFCGSNPGLTQWEVSLILIVFYRGQKGRI